MTKINLDGTLNLQIHFSFSSSESEIADILKKKHGFNMEYFIDLYIFLLLIKTQNIVHIQR